MQRGGLLPLHFFMQGRSEASTRFLDLACGTGRYLTFVRDNYPHMKITGVSPPPRDAVNGWCGRACGAQWCVSEGCVLRGWDACMQVDLSPFYLAKAVENDTYFRGKS